MLYYRIKNFFIWIIFVLKVLFWNNSKYIFFCQSDEIIYSINCFGSRPIISWTARKEKESVPTSVQERQISYSYVIHCKFKALLAFLT